MGQQRPDRAGDRVARLVLAARDRQLDVGAHALDRQAGGQQHAEDRGVRMPRHHRDHVVDRGVDAGGGGVAARLDLLIAGVIGDAVDHRLRPGIHVLEPHVGEPGDVLEAFGRQRQGKGLDQIGVAGAAQARRECARHGAWNCGARCLAPCAATPRETSPRAPPICASPSLRIMLWPIRRFISPAGWCEENTSMRFSWLKMSSRRVKTVEPSCGTKAIGACCRIRARSG